MDVDEYSVGDLFKRAYRFGVRKLYMNCGLLLTASIAAVGITMCSDMVGCSSLEDDVSVEEAQEGSLEYSVHSMAPKHRGRTPFLQPLPEQNWPGEYGSIDASADDRGLPESWNPESYSGPEE